MTVRIRSVKRHPLALWLPNDFLRQVGSPSGFVSESALGLVGRFNPSRAPGVGEDRIEVELEAGDVRQGGEVGFGLHEGNHDLLGDELLADVVEQFFRGEPFGRPAVRRLRRCPTFRYTVRPSVSRPAVQSHERLAAD